MSRLHSRLKKLEAVMTDDRGLIPHTPRWLAYWTSQLAKLAAGEELADRILRARDRPRALGGVQIGAGE